MYLKEVQLAEARKREYDRSREPWRVLEFENSPWFIQQQQCAKAIEQGHLSEANHALSEYIRWQANYIRLGGGFDAEDINRKRQEYAQQIHDLQTLEAHAGNLKEWPKHSLRLYTKRGWDRQEWCMVFDTKNGNNYRVVHFQAQRILMADQRWNRTQFKIYA